MGKGIRIECAICGFVVPLDDAVRHYKSRKWVDRKCADQMGAADIRARYPLPVEGGRNSPQPVSGQGPDGYSSGFGAYPFGEWPFGW